MQQAPHRAGWPGVEELGHDLAESGQPTGAISWCRWHQPANRRSEELNPLRLQPSGVAARKNLWEIRDPYDVSRIFVRGPDGWVICYWRHLDRAPVPFGELAWDHARRHLVADGRAATGQQIANAVAGLLTRACQGPREDAPKMPKRDRRVAARAKAATPHAAAPAGRAGSAAGTPAPVPPGPRDDDETSAGVIPLGIFDPFREADKRW